MPDKKPKPKPFNANDYSKTTTKMGKKIQRNSKEVVSPGINPIQRSSMQLNYKRVSTEKFKPMKATYGGSKNGKGATMTRIARRKG